MDAILVIDVWDNHWDARTNKILKDGFAKKIDSFLKKMRGKCLIVHAPSQCAPFYDYGSKITVPNGKYAEANGNALFFGYIVSGKKEQVWTRQHKDIEIMSEDVVVFEMAQILWVLEQKKVKRVYLVGMHLGMCVMEKAQWLRKYGFEPVIVEDLVEVLVLSKPEALASIKGAGYAITKRADIERSR